MSQLRGGNDAKSKNAGREAAYFYLSQKTFAKPVHGVEVGMTLTLVPQVVAPWAAKALCS